MFDRIWPLLLAAAFGAGAGWWVAHQHAQAHVASLQSRWDTQRAALAHQQAQATQRAHRHTITLQREVEHAQSDARLQRQNVARATAAARTELERLRATLRAADATLRVPAHPGTACDAGAVCTGLLDECASRYQALAADADQLAIDLRTLISAWPRNPQDDDHGR